MRGACPWTHAMALYTSTMVRGVVRVLGGRTSDCAAGCGVDVGRPVCACNAFSEATPFSACVHPHAGIMLANLGSVEAAGEHCRRATDLLKPPLDPETLGGLRLLQSRVEPGV